MIWLVGNRGMLGQDMAAGLVEAGLPFFGTDMEVDITDPEAIQAELNRRSTPIQWVVNCAAYTAVDKAEQEQELAHRINATGPANLAKAAGQINAALIHLSTDYVFDGCKDGSYAETDSPSPMGAYGQTKWEGELLVARNLARHVIVRTAWLYGSGGPNFVRTMLRLFAERDELGIVADQWGSPTYSRDLAAAIVTIIQTRRPQYGTYHFTNAGRTNWYEFACAIYAEARESGLISRVVRIHPITTAEFPTPARRPANSHLNKDKYRQTFGADVRHWRSALRDFLKESSS